MSSKQYHAFSLRKKNSSKEILFYGSANISTIEGVSIIKATKKSESYGYISFIS